MYICEAYLINLLKCLKGKKKITQRGPIIIFTYYNIKVFYFSFFMVFRFIKKMYKIKKTEIEKKKKPYWN